MSNDKNKPIWTRKAHNLEAALWKNETTDPQKGAFFSVSLTRSYKVGDDWKSQSIHLFEEELLYSRDLCRKASDALVDAVTAARAEQAAAEKPADQSGDQGGAQ